MTITSTGAPAAPDVPAPLLFLLPAEAATFLFAALLHLGVRVPLGIINLSEPQIIPATVVEAAIGVSLGVAAYGSIRGRQWARNAVIAASSFSIAGVLLGVTALAAGWGPATPLNSVYHGTMLVLLIGTLVALLAAQAGGRATKRRG